MVYLYNGIISLQWNIIQPQKKWSIDKYQNMAKLWKHYANWKKQDTRNIT